MIDLIVEAGPQAGQCFAVEGATVLGRGQFADLMISDLAVSRRHARLDKDGGNWRLRDLKSANGTRHNGQLILNPTEVGDGDSIELGQTRLRVRNRTGATQQDIAEPKTLDHLRKVTSSDIIAAEQFEQPTPMSGALFPNTTSITDLYQTANTQLRIMARIGQILGGADEKEVSLQNALRALAEAFPLCNQLAVVTHTGQRRSWHLLAQHCSSDLKVDEKHIYDILDEDYVYLTSSTLSAPNYYPVITTTDASLPLATHLPKRLPGVVAAVPIRNHGTALGVMYLDSREASAIKDTDREFLVGIASQLGALLATHP